MEGLCRSYSPAANIRKTLRRETRSISEWREKGKYQPFDLAKALEEQRQRQLYAPERTTSWRALPRKPAWSPTLSIEIEFGDFDSESDVTDGEEEYAEDVEMKDGYVYRGPVLKGHATQDYFSVPRTAILEEAEEDEDDVTQHSQHPQHPSTELFTEEPLAADIPEAELESSRRRSIEIDRQPLYLETKDDEVMVDDIAKHLADPTLDPAATAATPAEVIDEESKNVSIPINVAPAEETKVDTAEPPSPEEIIEHSSRPGSRGSMEKPAPKMSARGRFLKAKKILFAVDVIKKSIPPAPLPDELIPDEPRPRSKKQKESTSPAVKIPEIVEPPKAPTPAQAPMLKDIIPLKEMITIEVTPVESTSSHSSLQGGVSLMPTPPPPTSHQHLFPPLPHSMARSDEGYLSGESDNESDDGNFGVSLTAPLDLHSEDPDVEVPLPEEIIATQRHNPRENERYQHHCLIHGHVFPKVGPLRSAGYPKIPFVPWISCERCDRPRLKEAWQCALLNQCGMVVCTPCHDELEYGIKPQETLLDAHAGGIAKGLELGKQMGMKIGADMARAERAKEAAERQEREARKQRRQSEAEPGFRGNQRSWETTPKQARRQHSMTF